MRVSDLVVGDMIALEEGEGLAEVPFTKDGRGSLRIVMRIDDWSSYSYRKGVSSTVIEVSLMDLDTMHTRFYTFERSRLMRVYR